VIDPKHTFESVVRDLRKGLENGTIVLDLNGAADATESPGAPLNAVRALDKSPSTDNALKPEESEETRENVT